MSLSEFQLIARYFNNVGIRRDDVVTGVGDDGAVLSLAREQALVLEPLLWICDTHFDADDPPDSAAQRALARVLNALVAAGATPAWVSLGLTLPEVDEGWLEAFAGGLHEGLHRQGLQLIGGDTTRGPLTIALVGHGHRAEATGAPQPPRNGDLLYVAGDLGDSALWVLELGGEIKLPRAAKAHVRDAVFHPTAWTPLAAPIACHARAAWPLVDGLIPTLERVLADSPQGATVQRGQLPLSRVYDEFADRLGGAEAALHAGTDSALLVAVAESRQREWENACARLATPMPQWVGWIEDRPGVRVQGEDGGWW